MDGIGEGGNSKVAVDCPSIFNPWQVEEFDRQARIRSSDSLYVRRRFCVLIVAYNRYNWNRNIQ